MLAGAIAVQEAGGTVMTKLKGEKQWHPMDSLVPTWEEKPPTLKETAPVGSPPGSRQSPSSPVDSPQHETALPAGGDGQAGGEEGQREDRGKAQNMSSNIS